MQIGCSQVQLKPKQDSLRHAKERKHPRKEEHSRRCTDHNSTKKHEESSTKISFSPDKLEHMKKLAHELSIKFSNKVASTSKETNTPKEEAVKPIKNSESSVTCENSESCSKLESQRDQSKQEGNDVGTPEDTSKEQQNLFLTSATYSEVTPTSDEQGQRELCNSKELCLMSEIMQGDSDDDLEDMKELAQELSKELSEKVQAAASINKPKICEISSINELQSNQPQDTCSNVRDDVPKIHVSGKNEKSTVSPEKIINPSDNQGGKFVLCPSVPKDNIEELDSAHHRSLTSSSIKINHERYWKFYWGPVNILTLRHIFHFRPLLLLLYFLSLSLYIHLYSNFDFQKKIWQNKEYFRA